MQNVLVFKVENNKCLKLDPRSKCCERLDYFAILNAFVGIIHRHFNRRKQ